MVIATLQCVDDGRHARAERALHHDGVARLYSRRNLRLQRQRCLGIAATSARGKDVPQVAHQRSAAEYQIDVMGEHRLGKLAMQLGAARTEFEHVSQDSYAAAKTSH